MLAMCKVKEATVPIVVNVEEAQEDHLLGVWPECPLCGRQGQLREVHCKVYCVCGFFFTANGD
jgi:hypothetical protein